MKSNRIQFPQNIPQVTTVRPSMVGSLRVFACRNCPFWGSVLFMFLLVGNVDACSRDINQLTPQTKEKFIQLREEAKKHGIRIEAICTYRSAQEQRRIYESGRSKQGRQVTWVRHSKHTDRTAFDIAIYRKGKITWEPDYYKALGRIALRVTGLKWGGTWKARDYGHFELTEKGDSNGK